jgi:hypothetical protein
MAIPRLSMVARITPLPPGGSGLPDRHVDAWKQKDPLFVAARSLPAQAMKIRTARTPARVWRDASPAFIRRV